MSPGFFTSTSPTLSLNIKSALFNFFFFPMPDCRPGGKYDWAAGLGSGFGSGLEVEEEDGGGPPGGTCFDIDEAMGFYCCFSGCGLGGEIGFEGSCWDEDTVAVEGLAASY